jgi:hypothetical protein
VDRRLRGSFFLGWAIVRPPTRTDVRIPLAPLGDGPSLGHDHPRFVGRQIQQIAWFTAPEIDTVDALSVFPRQPDLHTPGITARFVTA